LRLVPQACKAVFVPARGFKLADLLPEHDEDIADLRFGVRQLILPALIHGRIAAKRVKQCGHRLLIVIGRYDPHDGDRVGRRNAHIRVHVDDQPAVRLGDRFARCSFTA